MSNSNDEWASGQIKEAPYWRKGMTPEEYDEERTYFFANINKYFSGTYEPLWKQKGLDKGY